MDPFPLAGLVRRIRRTADCSQRQLADLSGTSKTPLAGAESGQRGVPVQVLARAGAVAGFRVVLLDEAGNEVLPMSSDPVRDQAGRQFPAHLDTRYGDQGWWHGPERYSRPRPGWTFDRSRALRDERRRWSGTPDEHLPAERGDPLARRAAERQRAADERGAERRAERWRRWLAAGAVSAPDWGSGCTCPAGCEYAEGHNEDLAHAAGCACRCDVG